MLISMLLKCSYLVLIILILNLVMLQQRLSFWLCLGKTWWVFETHSAEDGQTVKMCMFWSGLICFESIVKLFKVVWRRFEHRLPSKHSTEILPLQTLSTLHRKAKHSSLHGQWRQPWKPRTGAPSACWFLTQPLCSWGLSWNHFEELRSI